MRLYGLTARFGPSPFTTAPCSVTRSGMRHSSCAPMSRRAAVTMRERSVVSRNPELSSDSRAKGTRNCPTVPGHRWCVKRTKRSAIDTVSGDAGGVGHADAPFPGGVAGGAPARAIRPAGRRAGWGEILNAREPMEPQPFRAADAVRAAGLEYINIPVSHGPLDDDTFDRVRRTVRELAGNKRFFFYCASGNRVGVMLLPYLMLDQGMAEDDAVTEAMRIGMRNAGLMQEALDYVSRRSRAT